MYSNCSVHHVHSIVSAVSMVSTVSTMSAVSAVSQWCHEKGQYRSEVNPIIMSISCLSWHMVSRVVC